MGNLTIDAFEFCRQSERLEGETPVARLTRLAEATADGAGSLQWTLRGGSNHHGHPLLAMTVRGSVRLTCQRCLQPFDFDIDSEAELVLAQDEASADEMDALLVQEDADVEVIVGSRAMDASILIEDDALLALPLSPRHEVCPDQDAIPRVPEEEKVSPFSVLKNLKR